MADENPTENSGKNTKRRGRVENLRPWPKGVSGNPGGRPKSHDELSDLIRAIAAEPLNKGKSDRLVAMVRKMLTSKDARDHANVLEHGWGKVPQKVLTWQDELIAAVRAGKVKPDDVIEELGKEFAEPILVAAGIRRNEGGETDGASENESGNSA